MININYLTILFLLLPFSLIGQDLSKDFEEWKNQPNNYIILDDQVDLTSIIYLDSCSYVGVFGANRHKFNMRFDLVKKVSTTQYNVQGKSLLKGEICFFNGKMNIERIEFNRYTSNELYLAAIGSYQFEEECEKGGVFKGIFRIYFHYDIVTKKIYDDNNTEEYNYSRGFVGNWIDSMNKNYYPCHFGLMRYPPEIGGDFDDGGGEPIINPKYRQYGWESHFESESGNLGFYWPIDCKNKWWLGNK